MGLFDNLEAGLKSTFGQMAEQEFGALLPTALAAANLGSLQGVVNQLQQAGLGSQVQSWVSGGPRQPISADELKAVLNIEQVQQLAQHFGIDPNVVLNLLAQYLPGVIASAGQSGAVTTSK